MYRSFDKPLVTDLQVKMPRRSHIIFGIGIGVGLLGACLLVAFGFQYLKPYLQVRSMEEGLCTVTQSVEASDIRKVMCRCSRDSKAQCVSYYPCVSLLVNVTASDSDVSLHNVTLYDSYETYRLMLTTNLDYHCTFHRCDRKEKKNFDEVDGFLKKFGNFEQSYQCFFKPLDPHYAIQSIVTLTTVVHTIFWPTLAVIFGLGVIIYYVFFAKSEARRGYPTSSLDRVRNINHCDNGYERVCTR